MSFKVKENFNSIIGFSGKIINKNDIIKRIKSKTKMLLMHGDLDQVVPSENLLDVKDFLLRNNVEVETYLLKNCGHNIPIEASFAFGQGVISTGAGSRSSLFAISSCVLGFK